METSCESTRPNSQPTLSFQPLLLIHLALQTRFLVDHKKMLRRKRIKMGQSSGTYGIKRYRKQLHKHETM